MREKLKKWSVVSGQWSVCLNLTGLLRSKKFLVLLISAFLLFTVHCLLITPVSAQLEIADTYDIVDPDAQSGDIVSLGSGGIARSAIEYDNKIFGVINANPLAVYRRVDGTGTIINRNGVVPVNVTTANGSIKIGDYITTSIQAGKGQKALASGYIIGVALKDFNEGEGSQIEYKEFQNGESRIEYAEISTSRNANALLSRLNAALFSSVQDPEGFVNVIRYVASGLVTLISIIVGLFILARVIPKGVEGIGRNPLARRSILLYTGLNLLIVGVIVILGIGASILLIRL
jgi:hypothetical protein